ncbi:unnamed protein product [Rotaria sp. Silwood2]|nr:unnamed protein product [Rotaria sp. Silwood2]CAF2641195.1 unnamed protein product [Rotaria sp. Silwood2]CAF2845368.1 unnamed protein product [Rotaria sp. Silwood2]CAF3935341.1 unnamed protein product [Rotaria sp. Silwood2]CAF4023442.1 unnamed protein product [Rotaria sp. Silwood2]
MYVYHYCLYLLAFSVLINSRYVEQSFDNEPDEDLYLSNNHYVDRAYRSNSLERYLRYLIAEDIRDGEKYDEAMPFERRAKAITKGDPREFMG